jgi:eukaryotic-like serine/threonine-protein kinase
MHLSGQQVMELFCEALSRPSPEARASFLAEACGDDVALRSRIEDLLRADEVAGGFLEGTPGKGTERPGTVLGSYKLLEQIGEGAFGIVFMAEQTQPVRRKVALKVLKPGMDTRRIIARFEAERQALALMEHPNIARVLDAGQTDSGRPYFVMELVRGTPITEFCDQNRLPTKERLELFLFICQAVQHAHAKGIIHRDLKPSNVLVTMHEDTPVVKVIDFGIAKALGEQLTEKTQFTGFAQMVGTPRYMSPEQSEKSGLDIDTRTDIYALGVLLYELLTGSTPIDEQRLRQAGYEEVCRLIREEEPLPPSTRIGTLGESATVVSACRASDPVRLGQLICGELDWIVLKALEKDRNRRYETASAFAADVRRYLADEPVLACPPSRLYRFGKFARRNKLALTVAGLVAVGAAVTIIELAASNALIRREQARTQQAKDRAEQAENVAEQQSEQIRDDLERLKTANVLWERSRAYVLESRWDDADAVLSKAVELRPDHATAWGDLGDLHARLGLWDLAAKDFAHELKLRESDNTWRWYLHALLRLEVGDKDGYRHVASRMRERFRGTPNVVYVIELVRTSVLDSDTAADREQLVELGRYAVAYYVRGAWWGSYVLGMALYRAGQHEEAARRLEESLRADDMPWSARALSYPGLAMARHRLGQVAEAREALDAAARVFDHWTEEMYQAPIDKRWVIHLGAAAHWPVPWWDWLEGRRFYREAKLLIDGSPTADDPRFRVLRARSLAGLRWHDQAETEYAAALAKLPEEPQIALEAHRNRGYGHVDRSEWQGAAAEFDLAGELNPADDHLGLFGAVAHLAAGEIDAYRRTCEGLVERFEKTEQLAVACNVILACVLRPDSLMDMERLRPLVHVASVTGGASPPETGAALFRLGEFAEAERQFEMISKVSNLRGGARCFLAMARHRLGRTSAAKQTLDEAARWIDEANRADSDDPTATRPTWGAWHERLECKLLFEEAKRMIE